MFFFRNRDLVGMLIHIYVFTGIAQDKIMRKYVSDKADSGLEYFICCVEEYIFIIIFLTFQNKDFLLSNYYILSKPIPQRILLKW